MALNSEYNPGNVAIIGIIPQYPAHSQHNIFANIKMPPVGIVSVLSQINHDPRFNAVYAIDENNYRGPRDFTGMPDHNFLQRKIPAGIAMLYGGMSNSIPRMYAVAQQYKGYGAVTIAGGSHVDAVPKEALNSGIDIVVHAEGEEITKEILEIIVQDGRVNLDRKSLINVKGISILNSDGDYIFTGNRAPIVELDELNDPDLDECKSLFF